MCQLPYNINSIPMRLSSLYRWGQWGLGSLRNLPNLSCFGRSCVRFKPRKNGSRAFFNHNSMRLLNNSNNYYFASFLCALFFFFRVLKESQSWNSKPPLRNPSCTGGQWVQYGTDVLGQPANPVERGEEGWINITNEAEFSRCQSGR